MSASEADDVQMTELARSCPPTRVVFDNIYDVVTVAIDDPDVHYVVGCMAWFSNKRVLQSMSRKRGCCIITMPDGISKYPSYTELYRNVRGINTYGAIRFISKQVSNGCLMHHKFILGMSVDQTPLWVINGSCNFSETSARNRENVVVHHEAHVANAFLAEFNSLLTASAPWNIPLAKRPSASSSGGNIDRPTTTHGLVIGPAQRPPRPIRHVTFFR